MTEQEYCNVFAVAKIDTALEAIRKCWPECSKLMTEEEHKTMLHRLVKARNEGWQLINTEDEEE